MDSSVRNGGTSNAEADLDSSSTFNAFTQDESSNGSSDDTFLAIQKELQALLVKFITSFLPCRELISFLVCQNAVTAMNFVTYVT